MGFGEIMKKKNKKNNLKEKLIWIPRSLAILYILFLSLFALDTPFGIGFLIHLIPSFILIAFLIFSWKESKLAGTLFGLFGLGTIIFFNTYRELISLIVISLIPILIGVFFYFQKNPKH
jgi:hypothetical protein